MAHTSVEEDKYDKEDFYRILLYILFGIFTTLILFACYNWLISGQISFTGIHSALTTQTVIFLGLFFLTPVLFFGFYYFIAGIIELLLFGFSVFVSIQQSN